MKVVLKAVKMVVMMVGLKAVMTVESKVESTVVMMAVMTDGAMVC